MAVAGKIVADYPGVLLLIWQRYSHGAVTHKTTRVWQCISIKMEWALKGNWQVMFLCSWCACCCECMLWINELAKKHISTVIYLAIILLNHLSIIFEWVLHFKFSILSECQSKRWYCWKWLIRWKELNH